jgi:glycine/D-amino acid oxidase-like deaminating enzyme
VTPDDGEILVVGQGLAGSLLAWHLLAAGWRVRVVDDSHRGAASTVAAGLINPIVGQRLTLAPHWAEAAPLARAAYAEIGRGCGQDFRRPLAAWRPVRDGVAAGRLAARRRQGAWAECDGGDVPAAEWAPWLSVRDGAWRVQGVERVDVPGLLAALAQRWRREGRLERGRCEPGELRETATAVEWRGRRFAAVIRCTGHAEKEVALEPVAGEIVELEIERWPAGLAVVGTHWAVPEGAMEAGAGGVRMLAGASHRPHGRGTVEEGAAEVVARLRGLLRPAWQVRAVRSGVRALGPGRVPVAGWLPGSRRIGVCNGLGSRGTLWAPWLARGWEQRLRAAVGSG